MFDLKKLAGLVNKDGIQAYLMLVSDHFTKWKWANILWGKDAAGVAAHLFTIFQNEGTPERWHCDNGTEFENGMVELVRVMLSLGNEKGLLPYTHGGVRYGCCYKVVIVLLWNLIHHIPR
jgi:hypothetical protein